MRQENKFENSPKKLGYTFPAEWEPHIAIWLSWPHNENSWPGALTTIYPYYAQFIAEVMKSEQVNINVNDNSMCKLAQQILEANDVDYHSIHFHIHPTNDAWCRDHGPSFLIHRQKQKKAIINWTYNAWGEKYPPYDLDNKIPELVAKTLNLNLFQPAIVMEGGAVEFNGAGTILTSRSCLLNPNRNPQYSQHQIEQYLIEYYGQDEVLWISDGIVGDDTDGHIDDTVRFINENTVLAVIETTKTDANYSILKKNLQELNLLKIKSNQPLNIIELPMPKPVIYQGQRLPASYANFYIANHAVIVPIFDCNTDDQALQIIQNCFPDRKVIGIRSNEIIWGLGSFHCLSQQEPLI